MRSDRIALYARIVTELGTKNSFFDLTFIKKLNLWQFVHEFLVLCTAPLDMTPKLL